MERGEAEAIKVKVNFYLLQLMLAICINLTEEETSFVSLRQDICFAK